MPRHVLLDAAIFVNGRRRSLASGGHRALADIIMIGRLVKAKPPLDPIAGQAGGNCTRRAAQEV
jgi:hypothetical protein